MFFGGVSEIFMKICFFKIRFYFSVVKVLVHYAKIIEIHSFSHFRYRIVNLCRL